MAETAKEKRPRSNWAQIASAVVALLGFFVIIAQVYFIGRNARIATARQVYMSYSEAALRYPELVEPDWAALRKDPKEYVRYKSFVSHMLFAYDEIFSVYDEPEWHKSFETEIRYHMPYICNDMTPADDLAYFEPMRKALREVRAKCPAVQGDRR
jgi:hypothetical protein